MPKRKAVFDPSGRAAKMRVRPDLTVPILTRLYPTAQPAHVNYLAHLSKVILAETTTTRCVATTADGARCRHSITTDHFADAMRLTAHLGSDAVANEHTLLQLAQLVTCKHARLRHYAQASIAVTRWQDEAAAARVMVAQAGERQKIRSRGLGGKERVEEVRGVGPEGCDADEAGASEEEGPKGLAFAACGHRSEHGFCETCRGFYA